METQNHSGRWSGAPVLYVKPKPINPDEDEYTKHKPIVAANVTLA